MKKIIPTIICLTLTISCSTGVLRTEIEKNDTPKVNKGYIYGRFYQEDYHQVEVGLFIENTETKKIYQIPFKRNTLFFFKAKPVYAIAVEPGTYRIKSAYGAQGNLFGPIVQERAVTYQSLSKTFECQQGKAYYIGDFVGSSRAAYSRRIVWSIDSFKENFDKTTEEFRKGYEKFGGVEVVNVLDQ